MFRELGCFPYMFCHKDKEDFFLSFGAFSPHKFLLEQENLNRTLSFWVCMPIYRLFFLSFAH